MEGVDRKHRYLDPRVLAKIGGLELRARLAVEGYLTGMHHSRYRGLSVEFADHRSYVQGDDVRRIDWKVFGRTDKHYVKQFEQEINLTCLVVIDASESMAYKSTEATLSKYEYAACVAASLAYLALRQRDAVGVVVFDRSIRRFVSPSSNPAYWSTLVSTLDEAVGPAKTDLRAVLEELAERLRQRTLVILLSDLFDDVERTLVGLNHLRYLHHELIVCNIWDPVERRFPFSRPTLFDGFEGLGRLRTEPQRLRSRYLDEVESFVRRLSRGCRQMQADYALFDTASPLDGAIGTYLATRNARLRQRSSRVLGV